MTVRRLSTFLSKARSEVTDDELARLQRDAEVRAAAFWDADEELAGAARSSLIEGLVGAITHSADDFCDQGIRVTPRYDGNYADYLKTDHWIALRRTMLQRAGSFCQRCHRQMRRLEVHHIDYRHLGAERDHDLVVLCRPCHAAEHGRGR